MGRGLERQWPLIVQVRWLMGCKTRRARPFTKRTADQPSPKNRVGLELFKLSGKALDHDSARRAALLFLGNNDEAGSQGSPAKHLVEHRFQSIPKKLGRKGCSF